MTNRPAHMSLLDYLYTYFGDYKVSNEIGDNPSSELIPTQLALVDYIRGYSGGMLANIKLIDKPGDSTKLQLLGVTSNGSVVSIVDLEKEDYLNGISLHNSTLEDIDAEICEDINIPLLVFTLRSGKKYSIDLRQFKCIGSETKSIITSVTDNKISAHLKIDNSIETPVIDVKVTKNGLKIDAILKETDDLLRLVRTEDGLHTEYTWDNGDDIRFKCMTYNEYSLLDNPVAGKIYFIIDEKCIYLNGNRYGHNLSLLSTDTIEVKVNNNLISLDIKIDPDEFNLISKSQKGIAAKLYWDE